MKHCYLPLTIFIGTTFYYNQSISKIEDMTLILLLYITYSLISAYFATIILYFICKLISEKSTYYMINLFVAYKFILIILIFTFMNIYSVIMILITTIFVFDQLIKHTKITVVIVLGFYLLNEIGYVILFL
jgi:hypothetical protein